MNLCRTIRKDEQCAFAGKGGMCEYIGGKCYPIIDECVNDKKCINVISYGEKDYCKIYAEPAVKWIGGNCPMSSNKELKLKKEQKINPLKASKRAAKARKAGK